MRQFLYNLTIYITVIAFVYLAISFLTLELNPLRWFWPMRLLFTIVVASLLIIFDDNNDNDHYRYT